MSLPAEIQQRPTLVWSPHPFQRSEGREVICALFQPNETLLEYLQRVGILEKMGRQPFILTIDGRQVPRALWGRCHPKLGTQINLYATVRGSSGNGQKKNPIMIIAMIALYYYAPYLAGEFAGVGATAGELALWKAGILVVGGMIISQVFPPPRPNLSRAQGLDNDSPTYSVTGGSNRARLYEPMPKIIGTTRIFPDLGIIPYTEFEGSDQILYQVFNFGYNDVVLSEWKIGETPIGNFVGVTMQESGLDGVLTLFPGNVDAAEGAPLVVPNEWIQRTTSSDTTGIAVEIAGSLFRIAAEGLLVIGAEIEIEYRTIGSGSWTPLDYEADSTVALTPVNGVCRVPLQFYNGGARKAISVQSDIAGVTILSTSLNTPAGVGKILLIYSGDPTFGCQVKWQPPGIPLNNLGEFVRVGESNKTGGGQFLLWDKSRTQNILISVDMSLVVSTSFTDEFVFGHDFTVGLPIDGRFIVVNGSRAPLRRTFFWPVAKGQYEVRVRRTTPNEVDVQSVSDIIWSQVRSYQPDTADYTGQKRVALKIRASDQLQGVVSELNCIAQARTTVFGGGYGLQFNGTTQYVNCGANASLSPTVMSVEAWIKPTVLSLVQPNYIWSTGRDMSPPNGGLGFEVGSNGALVLIIVLPSGVSRSTNSAGGLIVNGALAHVCATYDGQFERLYVNGVQVVVQDFGTVALMGPIPATYFASIGNLGLAGGNLYNWPGTIDEVRFYSRAITAAEVADHYRGRYDDESGLVGRWEFDEGAGVTANDSSGNGNHGTLVNGPAWVAGDSTIPRGNVVTSNPAWWFLDVTRGKFVGTRRVWGAGYADAKIDIEGLKAFGAWCAQENLTVDGVFDQQLSVYDMLSQIALMGRATPSWGSGKFGTVWDAPDLPSTALFGMQNIIPGSFSIEYTNEDLAEVLEGWFINPDNGWKRDFVRVTIPGASSEARVNKLEFLLCKSRILAAQLTNLYAAQNIYRNRRYRWRSDWEAMPSARGDVVQLSHDLASMNYSGRLVEGSTASVLKLPKKVPLESGGAWITLQKPDGTFDTYSVQGGSGLTDSLTLDVALSFNPGADAAHPPYDYRWLYGPTPTPGRLVKIEGLKPVSESEVEVVAVDENPAFYASKNGIFSYVPPTPGPGEEVVSNFALSEEGVPAGVGYHVRVVASWDTSIDFVSAFMRVSIDGTPEFSVAADARNKTAEFTIKDRCHIVATLVGFGFFKGIRRVSTQVIEKNIDWASLRDPSDVQEFYLDGNTFKWEEVADIDVIGYVIRFQYGSNASLLDAMSLHEGVLPYSPKTFEALPSGLVTFMITAIDAANLESKIPGIIIRNLGDPDSDNVVVTLDFEVESWPGSLAGGTEVGSNLEADTETSFYNIDGNSPRYDSDPNAPFYLQDLFKLMVYETLPFSFSSEWIGSSMLLTHTIQGQAVKIEVRRGNESPMYDADPDSPFYGADTDPFYGPPTSYVPWTGFVTFEGGEYQLRITTGQSTIQGIIDRFVVILDVPDLVEHLGNITVPDTGLRLPITKDFEFIKTVQITLQDDGGLAVSARVVDKDPDLGPLVECTDEVQTLVAGRIDATITGR